MWKKLKIPEKLGKTQKCGKKLEKLPKFWKMLKNPEKNGKNPKMWNKVEKS